MMVSNVMETNLITVNIDDRIGKAQKLMKDNRIGCLPVLNADKRLVGIITTWDAMMSHPGKIVADVMTTPVISVNPYTSIWEAKELMEKNNIERLLVLENDQLIGLVTKTRLFSEVTKHYDILTQLYRIDYLIYQGARLLEKGVEISVIFMDLDEFGNIDKKYGHMFGDYILKELGSLLKKSVPGDCFLCRYGGDEFVVLTPYGKAQCMELAKKLLAIISEQLYGADKVSITASAGIAGVRCSPGRPCHEYVDDMKKLLNHASLASTKAKSDGKPIEMADE
ncbi:MAG: CBS domain-containing protein [Clostridiales bacterium]|nr:CBS domain-containing protein [Clostridiales bacterium]